MDFIKYLERYHNLTYEDYLKAQKATRDFCFEEFKRFKYGDIKCVYFANPHVETE